MALVAFRAPAGQSLRMSENSEPLLAVAAVLLAYGVAEVAHTYGFVAVFVCALTVRSAERDHEYHELMHQVVQRLERILTLIVLLLLGVGADSRSARPADLGGGGGGRGTHHVRPAARRLGLARCGQPQAAR